MEKCPLMWQSFKILVCSEWIADWLLYSESLRAVILKLFSARTHFLECDSCVDPQSDVMTGSDIIGQEVLSL